MKLSTITSCKVVLMRLRVFIVATLILGVSAQAANVVALGKNDSGKL